MAKIKSLRLHDKEWYTCCDIDNSVAMQFGSNPIADPGMQDYVMFEEGVHHLSYEPSYNKPFYQNLKFQVDKSSNKFDGKILYNTSTALNNDGSFAMERDIGPQWQDGKPSLILQPLCLEQDDWGNASHYIGITIEPPQGDGAEDDCYKVSIFNPFGANSANYKKAHDVLKAKLTEIYSGKVRFKDSEEKLQTDGHSCGPWVVEFIRAAAKARVSNKKTVFSQLESIVTELKKYDIIKCRQEYAQNYIGDETGEYISIINYCTAKAVRNKSPQTPESEKREVIKLERLQQAAGVIDEVVEPAFNKAPLPVKQQEESSNSQPTEAVKIPQYLGLAIGVGTSGIGVIIWWQLEYETNTAMVHPQLMKMLEHQTASVTIIAVSGAVIIAVSAVVGHVAQTAMSCG